MDEMIVIATDIGYGKCKVAVSRGSGQEHFSFRSIAEQAVAGDIGAGILKGREVVRVEVDGAAFDVGDDAGSLSDSSVSQVLHEDYIRTPEYRALFHACLAKAGVEYVDLLVTGLPVSHYFKHKDTLAQMLTGSHKIAPGRRVQIGAVRVVPQPLGGTLEYGARVMRNQGEDDLEDLSLLVLDPGQFTFDWLVVREYKVDGPLCDSHPQGMYSVFSQVRDALHESHGGGPDVVKIASAVERGKSSVYAAGQRAELAPLLDTAVGRVSGTCLKALHNKLGSAINSIDRVLLVGGGARLFQPKVRAFLNDRGHNRVPVVISPEPAFANVNGYMRFGLRASTRIRRAV